jgi:serine/threonine protein kinase
MSAESGGKPPSGSSPGRPAADTPQRLIVRSGQPPEVTQGVSETAVATATHSSSERRSDHSIDATMDPDEDPRATPSGEKPKAGGTSSTQDIIGTTLAGRYLVKRQIGQGGMGAVYEATHTLIGKRVAVKVLLEKYAEREGLVARLKKEAQLASSIGNEHIIDINDIGNTDDGRTFVVMEYLDGESLAECLARERELPEQRTLYIASQAASALGAAHAEGIVHRDIKPENLFLLKRKDKDFVKVVDFGISKSLRVTGGQEEAQRLTQTGMVLGTPLYMSPEQARGDEDLDHRVDIYALGVIMYEAIAGRVPFAGSNYLSVISQVLNEDPKPLRELRPDVSEELEAIIAKAMMKERTLRYDDADAMLKDITSVLEDPTHSTERARITGPRKKLGQRARGPRTALAIGGIGIALALVMLAVVLLMSHNEPRAKQDRLNLVPPLADAAVAVVAPDAAPVVPPAPMITLTIETEPAGAIIYRDEELIGPSPQALPLIQRDRIVKITATLDGYNNATTTINPLERSDGQHIPLKLIKLAKNAPQPQRPRGPPGTGLGSAVMHEGTAGGELTGYPPHDTLPKKK